MLINIEPIKNENIPFLAIHPIYKDSYVMLDDKIVDIFEDNSALIRYNDLLRKQIRNCDTVGKILLFIRPQYYLNFMDLLNLSKNEITFLLSQCWPLIESPHQDIAVSVPQIRKMFAKIDKKKFMNNEDYKIYENLPDEVIIYRGIRTSTYYDALSWSLSKDKAKWFAERFMGMIQDNPSLWKATVNKKDIFAYTNCRSEQELIVDYKKIKDIELVPLDE